MATPPVFKNLSKTHDAHSAHCSLAKNERASLLVFLVELLSRAERFHEKNRLVFCREARSNEILEEIGRSRRKKRRW
jgi:hypothetical protein